VASPGAAQAGRPRLGEILLARGLVTREQLEQALRAQVGGVRRLGAILVRMKVLSDGDITDAIASQLGLPVADIGAEFRPEARDLLPRHVCRRYGVIPLAIDRNNVLRLGMADPFDREAIAAVEHYTGRAVEPVLARLGDITRAIPRSIALTRHDFLNPLVYRSALGVSLVVVLLLGALLGFSAYRWMRLQRYGTETCSGAACVYQNHDLTVDVGGDGRIRLGGRGAYADGPFGVSFADAVQFEAFVATQDRQLSRAQRDWLAWLVGAKLSRSALAERPGRQ